MSSNFTSLRLAGAGRAGPPPELHDAPEHLARLFDAWQTAERVGASAEPTRKLNELIEAMWPHRNRWFLHGDLIFWLSTNSRGWDTVRVAPRRVTIGKPESPS